MADKINNSIKKLFEKLEDFWESYHVLVSVVLAVITGIAFYCGYIFEFRVMLVNIVPYATMLLTIIGVFLTVFITLSDKEIFKRYKMLFPQSNKKIIRYMRLQFFYGIMLVILTILILILPSVGKIDALGVGFWSFFFWGLSFGCIFVVKLLCELILKDADPVLNQRLESKE